MIDRLVRAQIEDRFTQFPAVGLIGPRQCGKTTLAKSLADSVDGVYYDLEQPSERLRLDLEWDERVSRNVTIVLDEAQTWPEVFPRLRGAIDADRKRNGRFLLLGSIAPALMTHVSQSLAGRLSLIELTPLLAVELRGQSRNHNWLYGGFPDGGVLQGGVLAGGTRTPNFPQWQLDYTQLLTQRDLPQWGMPAKPQVTVRLLQMLAAVHGQTWNASQIGQSLGLDAKTVTGYVDFLVGVFLFRRLLPYSGNVKKRLVKTPKIYWRDTGLLHAMLNVTDEADLIRQPWVGASWEGYVIEQILATLSAIGTPFTPYFFRTSDQFEIDLVLDMGSVRWAIEIKLSSTPGPGDLSRLQQAGEMMAATHLALVSRTKRPVESANTISCDLATLLERLMSNHTKISPRGRR